MIFSVTLLRTNKNISFIYRSLKNRKCVCIYRLEMSLMQIFFFGVNKIQIVIVSVSWTRGSSRTSCNTSWGILWYMFINIYRSILINSLCLGPCDNIIMYLRCVVLGMCYIWLIRVYWLSSNTWRSDKGILGFVWHYVWSGCCWRWMLRIFNPVWSVLNPQRLISFLIQSWPGCGTNVGLQNLVFNTTVWIVWLPWVSCLCFVVTCWIIEELLNSINRTRFTQQYIPI